jgi:hypothetical protein
MKGNNMPTVEELNRELHVVGYRFEMRSGEDYSVGDEFVWGGVGVTLRVTSKRPDDGHFIPHWPWPFMYGFEVTAAEETQGLRRGTI